MSDPLWIGAGRGDSVGTATVATNGVFAITAHGLDEGQPVELDNLSGGLPGVVRTGVTYFAINVTTDDFQLVSAPGDEIITFASTGGADVYTRVPHHSAAELRQAIGGLMYQDNTDALGARQGLLPKFGPFVTVSGTTWTVHDNVAVVYPGLTAQAGPYLVPVLEESGSIVPADGSNDRIDALDLQIQDDDEDESGFRRARVVYVAGAPAASPTPPAVTATSLRLALIDVPSGGSPSPSIDEDDAQFTVARGGILPVRHTAHLPSSLTSGSAAFDIETDRLLVRSGGSWEPVAQVGGLETVFDEVINGTTDIPIPSSTYDQILMSFYGELDDPGNWLQIQINASTTPGLHQTAFWTFNPSTASVDDNDALDTTVWRIARWSANPGNTAECTIFGTDADQILSYEATGHQQSDSTSFRRRSFAHGQLGSAVLLTSIEVGGVGGSIPENTKVIIKGHRPL